MRKIVNISLPDHLHEEVEKAMQHGKYGTKSEFFREILHAWKEGRLQKHQKQFDAQGLLGAVKKNAGTGKPKNLSEKHDLYLYGE